MELFHRVIVSSAKGGIGKSTTALGTAAALAALGRRTLLVDCDVGNRCLDLMLGMEDRILCDLGDVAAERCDPSAAVTAVPGLEALRFCAAPYAWPDGVPIGRLPDALRALTETAGAEFIVCDTAGSGETVRSIVSDFADGALILSTQQPASIRSAERTAQLIASIRPIPCRLVISCFDDRAARRGKRAGLLEIIDRTHVRTIGVVPLDPTLLLSQEGGRIPEEGSRAGIAFSHIARRILGEDVRLFDGMGALRARRVL